MLLSRILIPIDFSERCFGTTRYAIPLVEHFKSELTLLHVVSPIVDLSPAAHEAFRSASVKPAVNLNKLREVIILVPNGSERRVVQSDQGSEKDVTSEEGIYEALFILFSGTRGRHCLPVPLR
jgi:nucleotide-binding universal stress UspA family protein